MDKKTISLKWISAWNNHDLEVIMSLYSNKIEHTSPSISKYYELEDNTIKDKILLKAYFEKALSKNPALHFDLLHILEGESSVVLLYKRMNTKLAAEYLAFDKRGLIIKSKSHYTAII